ncbi:SPOR domain-containing protein [Kushneria aurantia]|uniref:SPOR domain-containing protein n=1 Tax=Kushneria aurantia TaxID=504092 RepID=A0ABV6G6E0_9GAMM|nr:SPOR domain-containing protein [Kushneria aurantia]
MKYGMRERISGTVIVVAIAIIVLPMLFDRSDDDSAPSRGTSMSIDQPVEVEQRNIGAPQSPLADEAVQNPQSGDSTTRRTSQSNQLFPGRSSDESDGGERVSEDVARSNEPAPAADEAAPTAGQRQTQSAPSSTQRGSGSSGGGEDPIMAAASRGSGSAASASRSASGSGAPPASAGGWALQAGSFGQSANADRLVSQLREQGFNAWQQPRGELSTVFIGPFDSRDAGERAAGQLQQRAGINGFVVERGAGQ